MHSGSAEMFNIKNVLQIKKTYMVCQFAMKHMSFRKKWFKNMKIYVENTITMDNGNMLCIKDKDIC